MSYSTVLTALHTAFATVSGIQVILKYEPRAVQETPLMYSMLDSVDVLNEELYVTTPDYKYRVMHRLLFKWQENEQSELELIPYVNSIPEAVFASTTLNGGALKSYVTNIDAGWVDVANVQYRSLDFFTETTEMA